MPLKTKTWCQQCTNGSKSDVRWLTKEINSLNILNTFLIKNNPYCICEALKGIFGQNLHTEKCHLRKILAVNNV